MSNGTDALGGEEKGRCHFRVGAEKAACHAEGGGFARGISQVDCPGCLTSVAFREASARPTLDSLLELPLDVEDLRRLCRILWQVIPNDRKARAITAFRAGERG